MVRKKKKTSPLNLNERAIRNELAHQINEIIVQRSFGNANGVHQNPAEKRSRTRSASKRKAINDQI